MRISQYITELATFGRHYFTADDVKKRFPDTSQNALWASLNRLKKKGEIAVPYQGFYLIIPAEYRILGCLPPEQFIPDLMSYLDHTYYVALLSAAEYYGAAHQRMQIFQVMTSKNHPMIHCGRIKIKFIAKKDIEEVTTNMFNTPTGTIKVSSPEMTAVDLCCYINQGGGLNRVFTVLSELVESIKPDVLYKIAEDSSKTSWIRRLGYLLDILGKKQLASVLADSIKGKNLQPIPLSPGHPIKGAKRNSLWKVIVNIKLENDL